MVEEAYAYVQDESLKAYAALLWKLLNSPITRLGKKDMRFYNYFGAADTFTRTWPRITPLRLPIVAKCLCVTAAILSALCCLPVRAEDGGSTNKQLWAESRRIKCYQNYARMEIVQKLSESTFLAYTRFSVGRPEPMILEYAIKKKPVSTGLTVLYPSYGLVWAGERDIQMESGFQRRVMTLKIGDKKCADLWTAIEKSLPK